MNTITGTGDGRELHIVGTQQTQQTGGIEKIDKYISQWNGYLKQEDFIGMEREYQKIREQLKELVPLEQTLKKARELENLHLLIRNRGGNLNLAQEEMELARTLT